MAGKKKEITDPFLLAIKDAIDSQRLTMRATAHVDLATSYPETVQVGNFTFTLSGIQKVEVEKQKGTGEFVSVLEMKVSPPFIDKDGRAHNTLRFIGPPLMVPDGTTYDVVNQTAPTGKLTIPNYSFDPVNAILPDIIGALKKVAVDVDPNAIVGGSTVTTVYSTAAVDGRLYCENNNYNTMRNGTGNNANTVESISYPAWRKVGTPYSGSGIYSSFDTSGIPDGDTVTDVVATYTSGLNPVNTDGWTNMELRPYAFGTLQTADWRTPAQLNALTLLATEAGSELLDVEVVFTSTASFPAAIVKTGNTQLILSIDMYAANTTPTGNNTTGFYMGDQDGAGTTKDPKLVITHAGPSKIAMIIGG